MIEKVKTLDLRLLKKRCVACGYDGSLLRDGRIDQCPCCGCDLHERPPRSYAEMEGLQREPVSGHSPFVDPEHQERVIHRWLAFLFLSMVGLLAIAYLCAAAMAV
ncbi:MAG: hypothetical protein EA377_05430 [Phycisphaerales bacterium]|nr:MAG: hypothetical protein EA377_05430 [Phycisphaerales bacterium]